MILLSRMEPNRLQPGFSADNSSDCRLPLQPGYH
jgi:hypothetical protein